MILKICTFLCFIFLFLSCFATESFLKALSYLEKYSLSYFGQFYSYLGLLIFAILIALALLPIGKKKIGTKNSNLSRFSWIAMLYSTGMGSGLLLRAIQEPLFYYTNPPIELSQSLKILSLQYTFYHWGFTPWSFYCLFGLILAHWHFNEKKPLMVSSLLTKHPPTHLKSSFINSTSAMATLIGVVVALCLGGSQWIKGLEILTQFRFSSFESTLLILLIILFSTFSAVSGIYKSIRNLSILNVLIAFLMMLYVFINGSPIKTLFLFTESYLTYLKDFIPMSLNILSFKTSHSFLMDWTYFYWAFWLAWTPFTAIFIAKISEGRSFREFIFYTLIIPSLGTFLWFSTFASHIFELIELKEFRPEQFSSIYDSLFIFLETLPFGPFIKILATLNVLTFLITSIDSAILVLSYHSSSQNKKRTNILWGVLIATTSLGILVLGGKDLLKIVSLILVLMALPLSILYFFSILKFFDNLKK